MYNAAERVYKTSLQQATMDVVSSRTPVSTFTSNANSGNVDDNFKATIIEPHHEKTGLLPMRKQKRRSASQ